MHFQIVAACANQFQVRGIVEVWGFLPKNITQKPFPLQQFSSIG